MKTLTKIIAAFCVILLTFGAFNFLFGFIADRKLIKGKSKQEYTLSTKDDYDIIFFGSSRAHHHYDTPYINDSLGIRAFNAGEDGRGTSYIAPMILSYIENNKPKLIVIELFGNLDGSWNDRISLLYPLVNQNPDIKKIANIVDPNNKYYLLSSLYRHNTNLIPEVKNIRSPFNPSDLWGYSPLSKNINPEPLIEAKDTTPTLQDEKEVKILEILLNAIKKKNIPVVGVVSPSYFSTPIPTTTDSIFTLYNIPFIDNSKFRLNLPAETYFNDVAHLNETGAREYTKYFMNQIRDSLQLIGE